MQHRLIVLLVSCFMTMQGFAQNNGNSPYSRFGIGDIVDENFMHTRMMGSIGTSYLDGYHINIVNPASYATLRATAFDLGMSATRSTLSSAGQSNTAWSGNLEYISLAFPIFNPLNDLLEREKRNLNMGMSFTLMPNSNVSYNITSNEVIDGLGEIVRNYQGNGGSYKFLWGNAVKYKDFSFGINLGYTFGNISYERNIDFLDLTAPYQNRFTSQYSLNGFNWSLGAIYTRVLNKKRLEDKKDKSAKMISIGARIKPGTSFNTNLTTTQFGVQNPAVGVFLADTAFIAEDLEGNGKLPIELGFGVSYYGGEKYMIGLDYSNTSWSNYENDADGTVVDNPLSNTYSVSLGGYYRPNYKAYNNYFKRVYYRYGLNYKTDPRNINGEQIDQYSLSLGIGFPLIYQRKISHANMGIELGRKGSGTPIEESFFKISLGFTFNDDEWFVKRKYN